MAKPACTKPALIN